MSIGVSRTTEPLRFDVGIGKAGFAELLNSPVDGQPQKSLLPGGTTVSQAIDEIFPTDRSVGGEIMKALVAENSPALRTPSGFGNMAHQTLKSLRENRSPVFSRAANEIENLLADTDLFEHYRLSLMET